MCELCEADVVSYGTLVPGWYLVRARVQGGFMSPGDWGIGEVNSPHWVWGGRFVKDPLHGLTVDGINALTPFPDTKDYDTSFREFREEFELPPEVAYRLVVASITVGFDNQEGKAFGFTAWLYDRIVDLVEKGPVVGVPNG